ncbi:PIN-like domain-containing protein [Micromonospora sp. NPDC003816]|uniref:PIN-like domain-containing protein n=1 Tax=Micromonospora sp. NPDC003816 TaxID=3364224 RepID=UPI0036A25A09
MGDAANNPLMLTRYRAWLSSGQDSAVKSAHRPFFTKGLVVLDANVLLDLYRYTQEPRNQVLAALRMVAQQQRLWLPHQVGLEFVRNREKAVQGRLSNLSAVRRIVEDRFASATRTVIEARNEVAYLLREMAHDDQTADSLVAEISEAAVQSALKEWRESLTNQLSALRNAENVTLQHVRAKDPLLPQIAELFENRIGDPPVEEETRQLVHHAVTYRYPNRIPPGFADQGKGTDLAKAGDFLLWEEIIRHAATLPQPRRVLLVSRDTKEDWYEQDDKGQPVRPWPALHDELQARSNAELLILKPKDFLHGAQTFLGAQFGEGTYEEVDRVSEEVDQRPPLPRQPLDADVLLASLSEAQPYTFENAARAPSSPGVHVVLDEDTVVYVGSTGHLRRRLRQHLAGHRGSSVLHDRVGQLLDTAENAATAAEVADWLGRCAIRWYETDDPESAKEALVAALRPRFNR